MPIIRNITNNVWVCFTTTTSLGLHTKRYTRRLCGEENGNPPPTNSTGLFHTAILYSTRKDLATIVKRLMDVNYPLTGASDHGVSEAIYLNDPDENGVELYWDRPKEQWQYHADGSVVMYTKTLDLKNLLEEVE